jgi:hypothetical protein
MTSDLTLERWAHMNIVSRFQLLNIITKCIHSFFRFKSYKTNWLSSRKNFSRWRKTTPHWLDISMLEGRRMKPRERRRPERRWGMMPGGRRWWWRRHLMRVKALRMSGLRGSSPPRVVQDLSLFLLAHIFCWMTWCCKYLLGLCDIVYVEQLNLICI